VLSGPGAPRAGARARRDWPLAALLLLPSLLLFAVWVFYPLARTVWLGLYETDFFGERRLWVGWEQYADVLRSGELRHSLWVSAAFTLLTVPTGLAAGLALAVLAHRPLRGITVFRTIFSSTIATSVAVASLMWLVLLDPSIGVLSQLLPFDVLETPGLLGRPGWALVAVSLTTVWQNLGFTFVLMTAGLQSVPDELYEAARVDGAGAWLRFWHVTVPMLSPVLLFGAVVLTISGFQSFGQIDLLTDGGPGDATSVLVWSIYDNAFGASAQEGVAAVQAVVLFVVVLVLSAVQFTVLDKRVHYG